MKQYMKYSSILFSLCIDDRSSKLAMYSLQGIVLHKGVIDGGHYWAQMK